jgi:hypothetical protein
MKLKLPWRHVGTLATSQLHDQKSFYAAFTRDLNKCRERCIIESPFITHKRMNALYPSFRRLTKRGVRIVINTRDPYQHEPCMQAEALDAIIEMQKLGAEVFYTTRHHRKLAIIDRHTLWEGSLNILSQNNSCEIMRRIESAQETSKMINFLKIDCRPMTKL